MSAARELASAPTPLPIGAPAGWTGGLLLPGVVASLVLALGRHLHLAEAVGEALGAALVVVTSVAGLAIASRATAPRWLAVAIGVASGAVLITLFVRGLSAMWMVPLQNVALVGFAHAVGGGIGRRIEHAGHVLPAACVAAAADLVSVIRPEGPSHAIASSERALGALALAAPVVGSEGVGFVLGLGDLVFAALLLGAAWRHGLRPGRTVVAVIGGAGVSLIAAGLTEQPIPALVAIGAFAVAFEPAFRSLRPRDRTVAWLAITASLAVAIVLSARTLLHL